MPKSKIFKIGFLILTFLFCFHLINNSIAGDCDNKGLEAGTPTITGNYIYPPGYECTEDSDLIYDTVNSAETIDRNGSAALVVIGNNDPFTWSVSGTGFTLETEGEATGPTNTLYADGTACGTATITVTGCDGQAVTGYVRCTTGQWVIQGFLCGNFAGSLIACTVIEGNERRVYGGGCLCSDQCHQCESYWAEYLAKGCSPPFDSYTFCEDAPAPCGPCAGTPPATGRASLVGVRQDFWECP
jgi:hypothetical protein